MKATCPPATVSTARLRRWQALTIGLMVAGYSGYYLCRSNFSIALPMLLDDLAARGVNPERAKLQLGAIASAGTLAYAVGKFLSGGIADTLGGRWNMLAGMLGAVVCTLLFAAGGTLPVFAAAWVGNRFVQSLGWPGMVKITGHWFASSTHGRVMGIVSLSYLFGDAAARAFLGRLIRAGLGWRGLFVVAAATLAALLVASAWLLRESPRQIGEPEPEPEPKSEPLDASVDLPAPGGLAGPLAPLLRSPAFWLVGLLSLGLTLLRETFNTWTPTYFVEGVGLSTADAAATSAFFPLAGGVSVLLTGFLADRLGRSGRAAIILAGLVLAGAAMATLGRGDFGGSQRWPVGLVTATAFLLIGPYSFLAGAIALDLGGSAGARRPRVGSMGSATSAASWRAAAWPGSPRPRGGAGRSWSWPSSPGRRAWSPRSSWSTSGGPFGSLHDDSGGHDHRTVRDERTRRIPRRAGLAAGARASGRRAGRTRRRAPMPWSSRPCCTTSGTSSTTCRTTSPSRGSTTVTRSRAGRGSPATSAPRSSSRSGSMSRPSAYLCAVDPSYRDGLSPGSVLSLGLQGGPMDPAEAARFEANPHHVAAVRLRRWDDRAKVPGLAVPGLEHYRAGSAAALRETAA